MNERTKKSRFLLLCVVFVLAGCVNSVSEEMELSCIKQIDIVISVLQQPDYQQQNGIIEIAVDKAVPGLMYSLNDSAYQTSSRFTELGDGDYTVFIKQGDNCKSSVSFELNEDYPFSLLTVIGGVGTGTYRIGSMQTIIAAEAATDTRFSIWIGDTAYVDDVSSVQADVIIPESDLLIEAVYTKIPKYELSVVNGTGSGKFEEGTKVRIESNPATDGMIFNKWVGGPNLIDDSLSQSTQLIMPNQDITVIATYRDSLVSYKTSVAPLFVSHCTSKGCHVSNEGNGERSLLTYSDQVERASSIRNSIILRGMPLDSEMPQEAINTIVAWIDAGTPNN